MRGFGGPFGVSLVPCSFIQLIDLPLAVYLAPSHHRQGIMSTVLKALLKEWAVPKMNCQTIWVASFLYNNESIKAFVKNGFKVAGEKENCIVHRGEWRTIQRLRWKLDEQDLSESRVLAPGLPTYGTK